METSSLSPILPSQATVKRYPPTFRSGESLIIPLNHFYFNRGTTYLLYIFLFLFIIAFIIASLNVTAELHESSQRCSPIAFFWRGNSPACARTIEQAVNDIVANAEESPPPCSMESFVSSVCTTPDQKYISIVSTTKTLWHKMKSVFDSIIEKIIHMEIFIKSYVWVLYIHFFQ
jgi:hypothetical protein